MLGAEAAVSARTSASVVSAHHMSQLAHMLKALPTKGDMRDMFAELRADLRSLAPRKAKPVRVSAGPRLRQVRG
jgi:hypothetical protein